MENKFKKLCMLLFTCATIFGLSYNNSVTVKATDNLQTTTTKQAVNIMATTTTITKPVVVEIKESPHFTLADIWSERTKKWVPNLNKTGFFAVNEDTKKHYYKDGTLVTNTFVRGVYGVKSQILYLDYKGCAYNVYEHRSDYEGCLIQVDSNTYYVEDLGRIETGWFRAYVIDGKNSEHPWDWFYSDKDGKIITNSIVDGYTIGSDGRVAINEYDNTDRQAFPWYQFAKTIEPLPNK